MYCKIKHLLLFVASIFAISAPVFSAETTPGSLLSHAQDSLKHCLKGHLSPSQRLGVLMNLSDVSLALNDDYTYVYKLWDEAVRQKNENAIMVSGRSLTLKYLNNPNMDSAKIWMDRCKKEFRGSTREPELAYLQLMNDIRLYSKQNNMAAEMIFNKLNIKQSKNPYEQMSLLYKMGTLALTALNGNATLKMKPWTDYMIEGYKIAKKLPFRESYDFRLQFLLALCYNSLDYTRDFISLIDHYRELPEIKTRPFSSHRCDILACARMFYWGKELTRPEVDKWFQRFCYLTKNYPYDCQTPYDYFFYSEAINYYQYTNNRLKILECCDSAIVNAPKYKLDNLWFYQIKGQTLASMGKWHEAYENSVEWMTAKDSVSRMTSQAKLMELQTQYDVDRLTFNEKVTRDRLIFITLVCVLLLLGLFMLFRYSKMLRQKNKALCAQIEEYVQKLKRDNEKREETAASLTSDEINSESEELFFQLEDLVRSEHLYNETVLSKTDLVDRLGTNKNKLSDAIRDCTGFSFADYIADVRMQQAVLLLDSSDVSVNDIAYQIGYGTYTSFYRAFLKRFGISPTEYRKFRNKSE
jgi:AraC-like DNA-binding protein